MFDVMDTLEEEYVDLNNKPIKRNPHSYPYSYDTFKVWDNGYCKEKSHSLYSDRMWQWNYEKFDKCCEMVFGNSGQMFYDRTPEDINSFINLYLGKEVRLTAILQGCNVSTGFPYWVFVYEKLT